MNSTGCQISETTEMSSVVGPPRARLRNTKKVLPHRSSDGSTLEGSNKSNRNKSILATS